jgi:hypothetical protein
VIFLLFIVRVGILQDSSSCFFRFWLIIKYHFEKIFGTHFHSPSSHKSTNGTIYLIRQCWHDCLMTGYLWYRGFCTLSTYFPHLIQYPIWVLSSLIKQIFEKVLLEKEDPDQSRVCLSFS